MLLILHSPIIIVIYRHTCNRPSNFQEIELLEDTLRSFIRQIEGMDGLDYACHLKELRMSSVQRRHERYKALYLYKIKEGLVPNISSTNGLTFRNHGRHGCICKVPYFPMIGRARKARDNSFALTAWNLWNSLPGCAREISGKEVGHFKSKLDKAQAFYPDIPRCSNSGHSYDRNEHRSNSLYVHYQNIEIKIVVDMTF